MLAHVPQSPVAFLLVTPLDTPLTVLLPSSPEHPPLHPLATAFPIVDAVATP